MAGYDYGAIIGMKSNMEALGDRSREVEAPEAVVPPVGEESFLPARIGVVRVFDWLVKYALAAYHVIEKNSRPVVGLKIQMILPIVITKLVFIASHPIDWTWDESDYYVKPRLPRPRPQDPLEALGLALSCGSLWGLLSATGFTFSVVALVKFYRQGDGFLAYFAVFVAILITLWTLLFLSVSIFKRLETAALQATLLGSLLAFSAGILVFPILTLIFTSTTAFFPLALLGIPVLLALYPPSVFLRLMIVRTDPEVRFYLEYRRKFGYPRRDEAPTFWDVLSSIAGRLAPRPETVVRDCGYVGVFGESLYLKSFQRFMDLAKIKESSEGNVVEGAQKVLALIALAARGEVEEDLFWKLLSEVVVTHGLVELYYVLSRLARLEYDHPEVELARHAVETMNTSILGPLAGSTQAS